LHKTGEGKKEGRSLFQVILSQIFGTRLIATLPVKKSVFMTQNPIVFKKKETLYFDALRKKF
jgi:hypothetical protein